MLCIRGYSDDIVSFDGDIYEEIYPSDPDETFYIALSNGVLVAGIYDKDGFWRFRILHKPEGVNFDLEPASNPDTKYSDMLTIHDNVHWILCGRTLITQK